MSIQSTSRRTALRALVVFFFAALVLAYCLPDIRRLWQPSGTLGYVTDVDNVVTSVDTQSPADRAGVKVGDTIDVSATEPHIRYLVTGDEGTALPDQRVVVAVRSGVTERPVAMVSVQEPMDLTKQVLILLREFGMLLFVGIGGALVLLRPSTATWAFYVFSLGVHGAPDSVLYETLPAPWGLVCSVLENLMYHAGIVGVAVFAVLFLHARSDGWRRWAYRSSPWVLLVSCGLGLYVALANYWYGWPAQRAQSALLLLQGATVLLAMYALIDTYVHSQGLDKQRIRWVVLGFGIALAGATANQIIYPQFNPPYWVHGSLQLAAIFVPLAVGYAVIKHRVIDVSFVVSRALVYAVLTTLLVGMFSIIDSFFTDYLRLQRLGTIAEVGAVVGFGIWFNGLHKRVDGFIDATFFRQRHRAEVQLANNAAALPFVTTAKAVAQSLVSEPVRTLSLASAALFRRGEDGVYAREESEGWAGDDVRRLDDDDDRFLALVRARNGPLSMYDHPWRTEGVPSGAAQPALVLPIIIRRELAAIVFYGSHLHGEALDPDEVRAIAGLATGAAAAYDHLDAEKMRAEYASMKREVASLRAGLVQT